MLDGSTLPTKINMIQFLELLGALSYVQFVSITFDDSYDLAIDLCSGCSDTCVSPIPCISPRLYSTPNARRLPDNTFCPETHSLLFGFRRSQLLSAFITVRYIFLKTRSRRV